MKQYVKHLIECNCILVIFKDVEPPIFHKFVVFSELEDETAKVKQSLAQCDNCGAVHKIVEVGQSIPQKKETSPTLPDQDEIKTQIPAWLSKFLEKYECHISTWQEAQFVYENKLWGTPIILAREKEDNMVSGKALLILGEELHKIENFSEQENLE
jgi:hypothetical protein